MLNDIRQAVAELYVIIGRILDDGVIRIFVFIETDLYGSGGIGVVLLEAGVIHSQGDDLLPDLLAEMIFAKAADGDAGMAKRVHAVGKI